MQPPISTGQAFLVPMILFFLIIGLFVGGIAVLVNKKLQLKTSILGGIIGSYIGGMVGYSCGQPVFLIINPIIGAIAVLYFIGLKKA